MKNYSQDEPNLSNQEDLPQIDTFRRSMGKLKKWGIAVITMLFIALVAISGVGYTLGKNLNTVNEVLSLKETISSFEKEGLSLKKDNTQILNSDKLGEVKPSVYTVGDTNAKLLVYIFKSSEEREKAVNKAQDDLLQNDSSHYISSTKITCSVKNSYIIFMPNDSLIDGGEGYLNFTYNQYYNIKDFATEIKFKNTKPWKEIIYKGESASWEGDIIIRYYDSYDNDTLEEKNKNSITYVYPLVKYKLSNSSEVGEISLTAELPGAGIDGSGGKLDGNKPIYMGQFENTCVNKKLEDTYQFTISWNGKQEKIILKAN